MGNEQKKGISFGLGWPDLFFGPVNLFNLPPAWYFYLSPAEKKELQMAVQHGELV